MNISEHETEAGVRLRVTELEAENARLQADLKEAREHWKSCEKGWNRVIKQAEGFLRERDRYKAQAERRRDALKASAQAFHLAREHPTFFEKCPASPCESARAAIAAEEEGTEMKPVLIGPCQHGVVGGCMRDEEAQHG